KRLNQKIQYSGGIGASRNCAGHRDAEMKFGSRSHWVDPYFGGCLTSYKNDINYLILRKRPMPRHRRIKLAHSIRPNDKIRGIGNLCAFINSMLRSTFGRSGYIMSNTNAEDPLRLSCMMPSVGS